MSNKLPITVTKSQLCYALGLYTENKHKKTIRYYTDKLRLYYLTDEVLEQIGITPTDFDKRGSYTFDALKTRRLFEVIEELKDLDF